MNGIYMKLDPYQHIYLRNILLFIHCKNVYLKEIHDIRNF